MKTHKRRKSSRFHGRGRGTCGTGGRKEKRHHGTKGGRGMSGTGKRADHKKTLILNLYGHGYFGKQGITSKKTQRDIRKRINIKQIELDLEKYGKKKGDKFEIDLSNYKILGDGEATHKLIIKAKEASDSAIEKVKKAGGEIQLPIQKETKSEEVEESLEKE